MRTVVSYDISDDRRRDKVTKIMEGYGYRVQYSVFECHISRKQLLEMQQRLRPLVSSVQWESIRFYPLSGDCAGRVMVIGKDLARELQASEIV